MDSIENIVLDKSLCRICFSEGVYDINEHNLLSNEKLILISEALDAFTNIEVGFCFFNIK